MIKNKMFKDKEVKELIERYSFIKPRNRLILIKKLDEDKKEEGVKGLKKAGLSEKKPYGVILAIAEDCKTNLQNGDFIMFNECEMQEMERIPKYISEDGLTLLPEEGIMADINIKLE